MGVFPSLLTFTHLEFSSILRFSRNYASLEESCQAVKSVTTATAANIAKDSIHAKALSSGAAFNISATRAMAEQTSKI
jgi:hypothetical protein